MKILVATDSFKGTLTSYEVGFLIKEKLSDQHDVEVLSVSDGGEGIIESIEKMHNGQKEYLTVRSPFGEMIDGYYYLSSDKKTAIIESAVACGISVIGENELNPLNTSTYGVGEIILDAIDKGAKCLIIGIGGTSTNDGGTGMLEALGVEFFDDEGNKITGLNGSKLGRIKEFKIENFKEIIRGIDVYVACDVDNPLLGIDGATYIYGPQKGATEKMCIILEKNMTRFADVTESFFWKDTRNIPGAGAAGGLGMCFSAYFNAKLKKGIDLVLDMLEFDRHIEISDLVITGEGKMDTQTERGKVAAGILERTKNDDKNITTIAICGIKEDGIDQKMRYDKVFSVVPNIVNVSESMNHPSKSLIQLLEKEVIPWIDENVEEVKNEKL